MSNLGLLFCEIVVLQLSDVCFCMTCSVMKCELLLPFSIYVNLWRVVSRLFLFTVFFYNFMNRSSISV